jgi:erythromycin esterase-like protein
MLDKLSFKNLIPQVLAGESEEIVSYFPLAKERIELFKKRYQEFLEHATERFRYWKSKNLSKADLAVTMRGQKAKRWDAKNNKPLTAVKPEEPNGFVAGKILQWYNSSPDEFHQQMDDELQQMGTGKTKDGSASNFRINALMDLLSLQDDEVNANENE